MKKILFIALLSTALLSGRSQYCPPGYSYMPSISSEGLTIIANKCLPDSIVQNLWTNYFHSLCNQPVYYVLYSGYRYSKGQRWVSDAVGCVYSELYERKTSGKWVEISKCLWYWENRSLMKCFSGENQNIEIPCCGHIHKTKPSSTDKIIK